MTPDEFREAVLPRIMADWEAECLCASPGFQKLLSFDFRDYGIGPVGLADTEILIDAIVRQRFLRQDKSESSSGEVQQVCICPQCQATCTERYAEFSISMYQSVVTYEQPKLALTGLYLVGFYGFKRDEFDKVDDFQRASTTEEFLRRLKAT